MLNRVKDLRMSRTVMYLVISALWLLPGTFITARGQGQMIDMQVLENSDTSQCASVEEKDRARNKIRQIVDSIVYTTAMTGCSGPGWRRIAFVNMTDTSYNCPTGLRLTSYSKRTCGVSHTTPGGCSSTMFSAGGLPYSRVCGRMRGYQFGSTSAFFAYVHQDQGIDGYYVDGVSLTHGAAGRRQHIWTFAGGDTEVGPFTTHACPCDSSRYDYVPTFVGNDYFCESGLHSPWNPPHTFVFYPDDVLWDGQNCTSSSTCCQLNNPPWFTKNLPNVTTDDIELRMCTNVYPTGNDTPIEFIELYVQ